MKVVLPDKSHLDLPDGATGEDVAKKIGAGLARAALAVKVDGEMRDLVAELSGGERIEIVTPSSNGALELIRHDAAHVMATAVTEIWPGTKVSIGPAIGDGFYYDFDFEEGVSISEADLSQIESKMAEHIKTDEPFQRQDVPAGEAKKRFAAEGQSYKVELIEDLVASEGVKEVSIYRNGPFTDLCRGPHSKSTGSVKAFKLLSVAGAYWRGDERNKMLTRIYGTAFFSKGELKEHLERIEMARARDHRKLGRELGLYLTRSEAPGMPFFLPNGMEVIGQIEAQIRAQLKKRGYSEVRTPHVMDESLWQRSGHYDNYREFMYFTSADERRFAIKPMNCPGACLIFESDRRSYRELPMRLAEFGLCTRREREGVLHGLMRVRSFVQDDAHIFCAPEQITDEVVDVMESIDELYSLFGFEDVRVELSTRPEKSIGTDSDWGRAEEALVKALEARGAKYKLNPGDGAFYGPKIDFHITDALGRSWQCGTCQLDFFMPQRFELSYTGADNEAHVPVLVHRALLGSIERFLGILIEHYGGAFPLWLAPVQALILPISDRHSAYAARVESDLLAAGVRAELDLRSQSIGKRVRDAELRKVPCILVVGDREESQNLLSLRERGAGDSSSISIEGFIGKIKRALPQS